MKVFQVKIEHMNDNDEVCESVQYVTQKDNSILVVTEYYTAECIEQEMELKSVIDVLTVCHQIK